MESHKLRFGHAEKDGFMGVLAERVHHYFSSRNMSPYANAHMRIKSAAMLSLYLVPYCILVTGLAAGSAWLFFSLWLLMAAGIIGIGTSVMHDAHHGSYSPNPKVNRALGYVLELIGGFSGTWKIQHNVLHHTYTNISGFDEDIDSLKVLRFSPHQTREWYHRYQFIYAWFFYMFMSLAWMTTMNYMQLFRYRKEGLLEKNHLSFGSAFVSLTVSKLFYYAYIIVLPVLFSGMAWQYIISGFFLMHFSAGLFLSCVFQPAHIMPTSYFARPLNMNGIKVIENSWPLHELLNTTNFAPNNKFLTWFIGGLNFQIEHHLFTNVCHVHYPQIAPIVKATAAEFDLPYHSEPSFFKALTSHAKMLKQLGKADGLASL